MTTMATSFSRSTPLQHHKHSDSMDSEISYFETTSSCTTDSWNSYFDGWEKQPSQDLYCPQIVKSPTLSYQLHVYGQTSERAEFDYLPSKATFPAKRPRPRSIEIPDLDLNHQQPNVKRYGLVSHGNQESEDEAITRLNTALQNSSTSTEDLLSAMYNPNWDVASLQRWYQNSGKGTADLALYKIMFSLKYTPDEAKTGL